MVWLCHKSLYPGEGLKKINRQEIITYVDLFMYFMLSCVNSGHLAKRRLLFLRLFFLSVKVNYDDYLLLSCLVRGLFPSRLEQLAYEF